MIPVSPFRFVLVSFSVCSFFSYLIWMSWIILSSSSSACFMISWNSLICCCASSWHYIKTKAWQNQSAPPSSYSTKAPPPPPPAPVDWPEPGVESSPAAWPRSSGSAPPGLGFCSPLQTSAASHCPPAFFDIHAEDPGTSHAPQSASGCRITLCIIDRQTDPCRKKDILSLDCADTDPLLFLPKSSSSFECFTVTSAELCWCSRSCFSISVFMAYGNSTYYEQTIKALSYTSRSKGGSNSCAESIQTCKSST